MRKPPWSVNKGTYVAIEATLGTIPLIGSVLQSVLKLIFQTHEEQHQENIPLSLKVTSSAPGTITATATVANKKVVTDAKAGQEFAITVEPENGRTREVPLGDPSYEIKYKQEDDQERQPQPPVININLSGSHQARVNIGSSDESMNVISYQPEAVFEKTRDLLKCNVTDSANLTRLLKGVDAMEHGLEKGSFREAYEKFLAMAADHMTILMPVIQQLTAFLGSQSGGS